MIGRWTARRSALPFTALHRERVESLALFEAAWAGNAAMTAEERRVTRELQRR